MENDNQNVNPTEETQQEQQVTKPEPNITVTNNGSTMTATVNPVDPMADPETPEDTQQEQQEAPSQEDNLQQTIDTQKQTDVDVKETLTSKGVDFDKLADEKVPADECTYCGTCLEHCTQQIDIPEVLEKVCENFETGFSPYAGSP